MIGKVVKQCFWFFQYLVGNELEYDLKGQLVFFGVTMQMVAILDLDLNLVLILFV